MTTIIIRAILSILLLCGVYSETGLWTTITLGLMFINIELTALIFKLKGRAE
jgi:hypothetical protein